jgi:CheY-like chemotaxis protein
MVDAMNREVCKPGQMEEETRQADKMKAIGTLAGGIANDLNNTLGIIVGSTDLALADVPSWSPVRENLEEIRRATLRARDLVKQILFLSSREEPAVDSDWGEPLPGDAAKTGADLPRGSERILFVDDEPMIMELGQRMLERQGYDVEAYGNGAEALESFRQDPYCFDLVVTDMTMPGIRGDHLAVALSAIRPDIPVILTTGYSEQICEEKARAIGIRDFVLKPLTRHELVSKVREVLDEQN